MQEAYCDHCRSTFEPRRKDQRFCAPRCKNAAKQRRKRSDPEWALRELNRNRKRTGADPKLYRAKDPGSVAAKFGFQMREGYTKRIAPKVQRVEVDCVIDLDDDFADYVPVAHALPVGGPAEIAF